ncbi:hypothetical protein BDZ94DRAFT_1244858 [Collybia nuda]|uniref:Uncharacterized protein n=1 Tax=Collybia nuda TaxID=64659 RepID=A0A9P5YHR1_9AGAR|nr:hypothetical protein BDZ94DRAFT_1244858 [Collybia nuda]
MGLSDDEIAKIKKEWEQKQQAKLEKEKEAEREKEKDKEKKESDTKNEDKDKGTKIVESESPRTPVSTSTPTPSTPAHERYALHRDFFAMRQGEHRKRRQVTQAKELAPRLPGAPSGIVQDKY